MKRNKSGILTTVFFLIIIAIVIILSTTAIYYIEGLSTLNNPNVKIKDISLSFMYSLSIWFSVNYGDYIPTEETRYLIVVQGFARELYMAVILGLLVTHILKLEEKRMSIKRKPLKIKRINHKSTY